LTDYYQKRDPVLFRELTIGVKTDYAYTFKMAGKHNVTLHDGTCWVIETKANEEWNEDKIRALGEIYYTPPTPRREVWN